MQIPHAVRAGVEALLAECTGRPAQLTRVTPVTGGCVSPAARIETEAGDVAFLKWGESDAIRVPATGAGMFAAEAHALRALAETDTVRVPAVLGLSDAGAAGARDRTRAGDPVPGGEPDGASGAQAENGVPAPLLPAVDPSASRITSGWLLLEWLEPGRANPETGRRLGSELAQLHRTQADRYGWPEDNYIGHLPQPNGWLSTWPAFWRERRLRPQLRRAVAAGHFAAAAERQRFERLLDRIDDLLAPATPDGASLLHGDLWGGNVHVLANGSPAVIDPSSYYGHREIDLAMSELFGGFDPGFYDAYGEAWPLAPEYHTTRRPIYQLYYLLVHVNLFGSGYIARTLRTLAETGV